jgi:hypothetical protein
MWKMRADGSMDSPSGRILKNLYKRTTFAGDDKRRSLRAPCKRLGNGAEADIDSTDGTLRKRHHNFPGGIFILATVQLCPPMPAKGAEPFDAHAFADRKSQPVEATYHGAAGWRSTGIDFPSYGSMSTHTHKQRGKRRLETPPWALTSDLQRVIAEYLVRRAFGRKSQVQTLPLQDQISLADDALRKFGPALEQRIDSLCSQYCQVKNESNLLPPCEGSQVRCLPDDSIKLASLEKQISNLDSSIIFSKHAAATTAAICYLYWRTDLDSPAVAEATGVHPPAVRQMIFRLWKAAERLGFSAPIRNQRHDVRKLTVAEIKANREFRKMRTRIARAENREMRKAERQREKIQRAETREDERARARVKTAERRAVRKLSRRLANPPDEQRKKILADQQNARRARRKAAGQCIVCGDLHGKPIAPLLSCDFCAARGRNYMRDVRKP